MMNNKLSRNFCFSQNLNVEPPPSWFYKSRHLLSLVSLGAGYFIYRRLLFYTMLNNNLFLDQAQSKELDAKNYTMKSSQMILGHHINMQKNYSFKKQRILIIGAGQTGTASTKKLLDKGYEVVLIDQKEEIAPNSFFDLHQNKISITDLFQSLILRNTKIITRWDVMLESHFSLWLINTLVNQFKRKEFDDIQKSRSILETSTQELKFLKLDIPTLVNQQIKPILEFEKETFQNEEELLKLSKCNIKQNDTIWMDQQIQTYCNLKYQGNYHHFENCNVEKFVFDVNGSTIGVLTNRGFVKADKILITAGYSSKELLKKLGYRLPIIPYGVHTLNCEKNPPESVDILSKYIIKLPQTLNYEYKNRLYILGHPQVGSSKYSEFNKFNIQVSETMVDQFNKLFKSQQILEDFNQEIQYQTITPDGQPIVNRVPGFSNIFVNIGNRDISHLGSAQLTSEIMEGNPQQPELSFERFYLV